jgi:hypothetical protein
LRFEYYTGKFPSIDQVEVKKRGNDKRMYYVMTGLDPGTKYSLRVTPECSEYARCEAGFSPLPRGSDNRLCSAQHEPFYPPIPSDTTQIC